MPVVSFYILQGNSTAEDILSVVILLALIVGAFFFAVILSLVFRSRAMRRALWFKSPFPESGCTGPMTDLSPVEAGIVISVDVSRLLTLYVLGLVTYEDIKILDLAPLKVKVLAEGEMPEFRKKFLNAVREDGTLDPEKMLGALDLLYSDLKSRISSYGIKDTIKHYLDKVDDLWRQIDRERTTSPRIETLGKHFPWLLLHEDATDNLERMFMTSPRWPTVRPIVKTLRMIRARIVTNEELLEHAAHHPDGIFANKSYRDGVIYWAHRYLRHAGLGEIWVPMPPHLGIDPEKEEELRKHHEERTKHLDKLQHMLELVEDADES